MKKIYHKVLSLLKKRADYQDFDEKLIARIWWDEMKDQGATAMAFLSDYAMGKYTKAETIRRARQKAQENFPELRGKSYRKRKEGIQEAVKAEIKSLTIETSHNYSYE